MQNFAVIGEDFDRFLKARLNYFFSHFGTSAMGGHRSRSGSSARWTPTVRDTTVARRWTQRARCGGRGGKNGSRRLAGARPVVM